MTNYLISSCCFFSSFSRFTLPFEELSSHFFLPPQSSFDERRRHSNSDDGLLIVMEQIRDETQNLDERAHSSKESGKLWISDDLSIMNSGSRWEELLLSSFDNRKKRKSTFIGKIAAGFREASTSLCDGQKAHLILFLVVFAAEMNTRKIRRTFASCSISKIEKMSLSLSFVRLTTTSWITTKVSVMKFEINLR